MQFKTKFKEQISKTKFFLKNYWVYLALGIYILFVFIYSILFIKSDGENLLLPSNELGDFLAGIISPVAFLFLILGYLQQRNVIEENTKILSEQMEELKLSKQLMIETNQPHFTFSDIEQEFQSEFNLASITLKIKNENQNCKFIKLSFIDEHEKIISIGEYRYLMREETLQLKISIQDPMHIHPEIMFKVIYIDIFGNEKESFHLLQFTPEATKIIKCPLHLEYQFHADLY
ncbi:hypothetical protein [Acinetobacter baumannii]